MVSERGFFTCLGTHPPILVSELFLTSLRIKNSLIIFVMSGSPSTFKMEMFILYCPNENGCGANSSVGKTINLFFAMSEKLIPVHSLIREIRGKKVLLDSDLAKLYHVETKALNQAVKRNMKRFPPDFMFQLNTKEFASLKSQIVTSNWGGTRKLPFAFTREGIAMLSGVLKSDIAIEANIRIMRAFVQINEYLLTTATVSAELKELRSKVDLFTMLADSKFWADWGLGEKQKRQPEKAAFLLPLLDLNQRPSD